MFDVQQKLEDKYPSIGTDVSVEYRTVSVYFRKRGWIAGRYRDCFYGGVGGKEVAFHVALELLLNDPDITEDMLKAPKPDPIIRIGFGTRILRQQPDPTKRGFTPK